MDGGGRMRIRGKYNRYKTGHFFATLSAIDHRYTANSLKSFKWKMNHL